MHMACTQMGLPVQPDKDEGPASTLSFLGIELDSVAMEIRLPPEKLTHLQEEIAAWRACKKCKKRELLSLIGLLSHACKVVQSGRSFLRRLIDLSTIPQHLEPYVRLNLEARSDIEWWAQYLQVRNGVSMMHLPNVASPGAVPTSDALGNWGCGAYSGPHSTWRGSTVLAQCDNMAVRPHSEPWLVQESGRNALSQMPSFYNSQVRLPHSGKSHQGSA